MRKRALQKIKASLVKGAGHGSTARARTRTSLKGKLLPKVLSGANLTTLPGKSHTRSPNTSYRSQKTRSSGVMGTGSAVISRSPKNRSPVTQGKSCEGNLKKGSLGCGVRRLFAAAVDSDRLQNTVNRTTERKGAFLFITPGIAECNDWNAETEITTKRLAGKASPGTREKRPFPLTAIKNRGELGRARRWQPGGSKVEKKPEYGLSVGKQRADQRKNLTLGESVREKTKTTEGKVFPLLVRGGRGNSNQRGPGSRSEYGFASKK